MSNWVLHSKINHMKAAQLTQYGKTNSIAINEVPQPDVAAGKVLVQVKAAGVNPFDWKVQLGYMKDFIPLQLPVTLGGDLSGVVVKVGAGVEGISEGDEVFGQASAVAGESGAFAEYAFTSPTSLAKKPTTVSFIEAGAAPLTGVSAVQALYDHMGLSSGQKILIHGGAGGIGTVAIQIAKHLGAHVITTVSTNDIEYVKGLGADEVIDYKNQKFEELITDVDAVFDTVGGETNKRSYQVLKQGGKLVSMVEQPDEQLKNQFQIEYISQATKVNPERLTKLAQLIDEKIVTVHIEKTFPLDQAGEALSYLRQTPPKGKVVLEM